MIIGTSGSRVIPRNAREGRRRTLLEISEGDDEEKCSTGARSRTSSVPVDVESRNEVKMEDMRDKMNAKSHLKTSDVVPRRIMTQKRGENSMKMLGIDFQAAWVNIVSKKDVNEITSTQRKTLRKYEETNEMLNHFSNLSESTFAALQKDYNSHIQVLTSLKSDLDQIFRRLRFLKDKMNEKYPEAVQATTEAVKMLKERQIMEMELGMNKESGAYGGTWTEKLPEYSERACELDSVQICSDKHQVDVELDRFSITQDEENQTSQKENAIVAGINNDEKKLISSKTIQVEDENVEHGKIGTYDDENLQQRDTSNVDEVLGTKPLQVTATYEEGGRHIQLEEQIKVIAHSENDKRENETEQEDFATIHKESKQDMDDADRISQETDECKIEKEKHLEEVNITLECEVKVGKDNCDIKNEHQTETTSTSSEHKEQVDLHK